MTAGHLKSDAGSSVGTLGPLAALRRHWPEYLIEAAGLGLFMIAAGTFGTLLFHPGSPAVRILPDPLTRRAVMGLFMGLTAIGLIYSPWGQQSGAHFNPAVTLSFWRLGKVATSDAAYYILAQVAGGLAGVLVVHLVVGSAFAEPPVAFVTTLPGPGGPPVALLAETAISTGLMLTVLVVSNTPTLMRLTGVCAGLLVALYITVESPLSGMSMNPARSLASALPAGIWHGLWVYFAGPPLGMLLAVELYRHLPGAPAVRCAKLNHHTHRRCIFKCGYREQASDVPVS